MGARNRDAAVAYSATPTILPSSKKTLAKSSARAAARPRRRFHRDQRSARRRAPKRTAHFTCERGTHHVLNAGSASNLGTRNRDAVVAASSFIVARIVVATAPLAIVCAATKRHHNVSAALRTSPRPRRALRGIVQCLRRSAPCAFPFAKPRHNVRKRSAPIPT